MPHLRQWRAPVVCRARQPLQLGVEQHDVVGGHVAQCLARPRVEAAIVAFVDAGRGAQRLQHLNRGVDLAIDRLHQVARRLQIALQQRVSPPLVREHQQHHRDQEHRHGADHPTTGCVRGSSMQIRGRETKCWHSCFHLRQGITPSATGAVGQVLQRVRRSPTPRPCRLRHTADHSQARHAAWRHRG